MSFPTNAKRNGGKENLDAMNLNDNIDFLAEVVANNLMETEKLDDEHVFAHLLGSFQRFFTREVNRIEKRTSLSGEKEGHIFLHREGLYDLLPEGLFHGNTSTHFKDREATLKEFRIHREEEESARLFFMPLEQEFFRYRVGIEAFERSFHASPETIREFIRFFDLEEMDLDMHQQASLFYILPHVSRIAGHIFLAEICFSIILQEAVSISRLRNPPAIQLDTEGCRLNKGYLGYDSLLGDTAPDDSLNLKIEIGPLAERESLSSFLFGRKKVLVSKLCDLLLKADAVPLIEVLLNERDRQFTLGNAPYESRLNYSTTLYSKAHVT
jgi:hypothetical protein